ncbi:hypothetical protein LTR35_006526 [Friedmanniomyces endolithicus]|uniref:Uncharacterized protein n=1 Tax=Friedmanniomyces endolithicus TaxID=329885 RepID=A0A4V6WJR5_9PEZI|nr:hypothetical protein LTR35_006526 [Friedmanniomyces endolithicus]TKA26569.1 hypothetical protein B0A54_16554 [Friedmanniomyces endolithicus]
MTDWKKPEDAFPPAYHFHIAHLKHNALNTLDLEHNPLNMADLPQHADAIELGNLPPNAVPQQQPQALLDLEERERIVTYREAQIASKEALYRQFQLTVESRGHWSRWSAIVLGTLAYIASWVVILVWRNDLSVQCTRAHGLAAWSVNVGCQMIVLHQVCSFIFDGMAYTTDHNSKTRRFCIFVLNHLSITMLGITLMESIWSVTQETQLNPATSMPTSTASSADLHRLPPELRNLIYELVLFSNDSCPHETNTDFSIFEPPKPSPIPPLTQINRAIRAETLPMW